MMKNARILALAGLLAFGASGPAGAQTPDSWIAVGSGQHGDIPSRNLQAGSHVVVSRADSQAQVESELSTHCSERFGSCSYIRSYNYGCIYAAVGNFSNGSATWGIGPTSESARNACESKGADCSVKTPIGRCVKPPPTPVAPSARREVTPMVLTPGQSAPTPYLPQGRPVDVSRGTPNYRPNEDEGPGDVADNKPKIFMPAEDMAALRPGRGQFVLCPEHDKGNRCFVFMDADKPGRLVTNSQLYEAEGKFKGGRAGGAEDTSLEYSVLLASIGKQNQRVRYQFADLAKGTTDGRYEGLMCFGKASEEKKAFPTWEGCAYVKEDRAKRTQ